MRTTFLGLVVVLLTTVGRASAATIGFSDLLTPGPFMTYTESGFSVSAVSGSWEASTISEIRLPSSFSLVRPASRRSARKLT